MSNYLYQRCNCPSSHISSDLRQSRVSEVGFQGPRKDNLPRSCFRRTVVVFPKQSPVNEISGDLGKGTVIHVHATYCRTRAILAVVSHCLGEKLREALIPMPLIIKSYAPLNKPVCFLCPTPVSIRNKDVLVYTYFIFGVIESKILLIKRISFFSLFTKRA